MKEIYRTIVVDQFGDSALVSIFFNRNNENVEIEKYMVNYLDEDGTFLESHFSKTYDEIDDDILSFCFFLMEQADLI